MVDPELRLLLIPLAPGIAFMLWVIWALEMQIRRDRRHSDEIARAKAGSNRPALTSADTEQRSPGTSTQHGSTKQP
jgi:hypothetical protein